MPVAGIPHSGKDPLYAKASVYGYLLTRTGGG